MTSAPRPLAVSMGDPAGIGLDTVLLAFCGGSSGPLPRFVLFGCSRTVRERALALGLHVDVRVIDACANVEALDAGVLPVVEVETAAAVEAGHPDTRNSPAVIAAIEQATAAVMGGEARGLATCPISKATLTAVGFAYPGHTEFLAALAERALPGRRFVPVMMLASEDLRVIPLTVHVPLASVPGAITRELIETTARIVSADLRRYFGLESPRIAVAGLNPHAGESGTMGREEVEVIAPAIAALRGEGLRITGPHSADTMFHAGARRGYDAVIAMYHDQALIPLKTLAFDSGVNVTLGLPFVRTSPDHGTAFDIAGTGRASPASFVAALKLAAAMAQHAPGSA